MHIDEIIHILTTEEKNAKLLAMELANDKGREILESIFRSPKNPSELAEELNIPLPTVMFHIERFLEIGMIRVVETELSKKWREIKYYGPAKKAILIIPAQKRETMESITEAVKTRISPLAVAVSLLFTLGIGYLVKRLLPIPLEQQGGMLLSKAVEEVPQATNAAYNIAPPQALAAPAPWWSDPIVLVVSGAVVALLVIFLFFKFKKVK
jgi:DNA-binding transcriptional ArsR family regulator